MLNIGHNWSNLQLQCDDMTFERPWSIAIFLNIDGKCIDIEVKDEKQCIKPNEAVNFKWSIHPAIHKTNALKRKFIKNCY